MKTISPFTMIKNSNQMKTNHGNFKKILQIWQ